VVGKLPFVVMKEAEKTDIERLKEVRRVWWKTIYHNIILLAMIDKLKGDIRTVAIHY
jgi:hypothetical protein